MTSALDDILKDDRITAGRAAVGESAPAGSDVRAEPLFEEIENEFRKVETEGPTAIRWKDFNAKSFTILREQSKDLLVAVRLIYGLFIAEGYRGVAIGLTVIRDMVASHWEGLFPVKARERGRVSLFDWLGTRVAQLVERTPPKGDELFFALVAYEAVDALDRDLADKVEKSQAALGPLIRALRPFAKEAQAAIEAAEKAKKEREEKEAREKKEREEKEEREAREAQERAAAPPEQPPQISSPLSARLDPQSTQAQQSSSSSGGGPVATLAPINLDADADKAIRELASAALRVATALRGSAPEDPRGYLCARFGAWAEIVSLPPVRNGNTLVPPPPPPKLDEIKTLTATNNDLALLKVAESAFVAMPFWLDTQRIIASTLQRLGGDFDAAHCVVVSQLLGFLTRLPGVETLNFSNGTPLADQATRDWIAALKAAEGGSVEPASGNDDHLLDAQDAALRCAKAGKILEGVKCLRDAAQMAPSGRSRFRAQIYLADFCVRHELLPAALPLTKILEETIFRNDLKNWEPALVVEAASVSWRVLHHPQAMKLVEEEERKTRRERIMGELSGIDMVAAARLVMPNLA